MYTIKRKGQDLDVEIIKKCTICNANMSIYLLRNYTLPVSFGQYIVCSRVKFHRSNGSSLDFVDYFKYFEISHACSSYLDLLCKYA